MPREFIQKICGNKIMKRYLIVLCALTFIICGCEKKNSDIKDVDVSSSTTSSSTSITTTTSTTSTTEKTTIKEKTTTTKKTTACRVKKFDKKYSYAYKTKKECMKEGNLAFLDISDNINKDVFAYDCRQIKDECGNTWYGAFFYVYNQKTSKEEEFYY